MPLRERCGPRWLKFVPLKAQMDFLRSKRKIHPLKTVQHLQEPFMPYRFSSHPSGEEHALGRGSHLGGVLWVSTILAVRNNFGVE
jgi:hypothetical protein